MRCDDQPCTCGGCQDHESLSLGPNPPGQSTLHYRVGTFARFMQAMTARLSSQTFPALGALTTREKGDFTLGLLDGWASVADVLTFYQERIAQEGYLRTATERRSVLELARLVGYSPRPGVAASLYLAYTLEPKQQVTIPKGSRAQSVPRPGQLPQTFETSDDLKADAALNAMRPRLRRPAYISPATITRQARALFLQGTGHNLKTGDVLLAQFQDGTNVFLRVADVTLHLERNTTEVSAQVQHSSNPLPDSPPERENPITALHWRYSSYASSKISGAKKTTEAVLDELKKLIPLWISGEGRADLSKLLTTLSEQHRQAQGSPNLADWLNSLRSDLESLAGKPALTSLSHAAPLPLLSQMTTALLRPPSAPPAASSKLTRSVNRLYGEHSDLQPALQGALFPGIKKEIYQAYTNAPTLAPSPLISLQVMRVQANLFGYNAPPLIKLTPKDGQRGGLTPVPLPISLKDAWGGLIPKVSPPNDLNKTALEREFQEMKPDGVAVIQYPNPANSDQTITKYAEVKNTQTLTLTAPTLTGKATVLTLSKPWLADLKEIDYRDILTNTRVYTAGEELPLADEPLTTEIGGQGVSDEVELDDLYMGLESGRRVMLSGERTDLPNTSGVKGSELLMIASVEHRFEQVTDNGEDYFYRPKDTRHTYVRFATPPAYRYRRDTVTLNGNVVKATHGETKTEVLGSGDGTRAFQTFNLKQPPLTYTAAPTAIGAETTLDVQVNGVSWHETATFVEERPDSRVYTVRIDDDGQTAVVFGNGVQGARVPTGRENVRAVYRSGIGRPGNVEAGQVSLLLTRPLGVKDVINPLPASGGADREGRDQARKNAPRTVLALDRLVSVQDYADFARTFAGIGKASATELSNGLSTVVYVTIAGAQDVPIDPNGDLYRNLKEALLTLGDPYQPLELEPYSKKLLVIQARVRVLPDFHWVSVEPQVRAALLDTFSFEQRELGQPVYASEVLAAIQGVPGVAYADLDLLGAVGWDELKAGTPLNSPGLAQSISVQLAHITKNPVQGEARIRPAELAFLTPDVSDTLILQEIP